MSAQRPPPVFPRKPPGCPRVGEVWRHNVTGGTYKVVSRARLQSRAGHPDLHDGALMIMYEPTSRKDRAQWPDLPVREVYEFMDRFHTTSWRYDDASERAWCDQCARDPKLLPESAYTIVDTCAATCVACGKHREAT